MKQHDDRGDDAIGGGGAGRSHSHPAPPPVIIPPRLDGLHPEIRKTATAMHQHVLPVLAPHLPQKLWGRWLCLESDARQAYKDMDRHGVDWTLTPWDGTTVGVASRVQRGRHVDNATFTIRYKTVNGGKTEWDRYQAWSRQGFHGLHPEFAVQGYVAAGGLVRAAMCRSRDLYELVVQHNPKPTWVMGGNFMLVARWSWWHGTGRPLWIVEGDGSSQMRLL